MLRPSFQRRMPPTAEACFGGSLIPNMNIMPLMRWTSRSPATPVPYSFQQRQRAKMLGSNARLGTVPWQVSQSRVRGERSGGGGYCHAPVGSLRPSHPSTSIKSPSIPWAMSSLALAQIWELTRCDPICTMRPVFFAASTMATPSAGLCDIGFSRSEEHTSELQSRLHLVCRLLLEKKNKQVQDVERAVEQRTAA